MEEKIHAAIILEILGRPKEHIETAIKNLVAKLGAEKGIKIISEAHHEAKAVQNSQDLFTTFAEVELELPSLEMYFGIMFAYMPSHIELLKPDKVILKNIYLSEIANLLVQRLHNYDAVTKTTLAEKELLLNTLKKAAPEAYNNLISPPQTEKLNPPEKKERKGKKKIKE